jgi:geranylgeranyl diphosphate synthase, type II
MNLPSFFEEDRQAVDAALDRLLPPADARPATIHRALRYSVFAGGKRVRPILCLAAARIFSSDNTHAASANGGRAQGGAEAERTGVANEPVMSVACALEFIHTYSLIHDDLPALDNDDLRRGQPTCHKQFGEANAILAGDALLTLAFETLAKAPVEYGRRVALIAEIATAAGTCDGMVGGQVADLESEGRAVTAETLEYIHRSKTAALIRAAILAGAIAGGAPEGDLVRLRSFGELIGWAFQVTDDILDVEESSESLGKTAGKDSAQHKATYPALFGLAASHDFARDLATRAIAELQTYGARAQQLRDIGEFLVLRRA